MFQGGGGKCQALCSTRKAEVQLRGDVETRRRGCEAARLAGDSVGVLLAKLLGDVGLAGAAVEQLQPAHSRPRDNLTGRRGDSAMAVHSPVGAEPAVPPRAGSCPGGCVAGIIQRKQRRQRQASGRRVASAPLLRVLLRMRCCSSTGSASCACCSGGQVGAEGCGGLRRAAAGGSGAGRGCASGEDALEPWGAAAGWRTSRGERGVGRRGTGKGGCTWLGFIGMIRTAFTENLRRGGRAGQAAEGRVEMYAVRGKRDVATTQRWRQSLQSLAVNKGGQRR